MRLVRPFLGVLGQLTDAPLVAQRAELAELPDDQRIPVQKALRLLDHAVRTTGLAELGLCAAEAVGYGDCDALQFAAGSAPDAGAALNLVARYARLLDESAQPRLERRDDAVLLELHAQGARAWAAADFRLGLLARGARALLGQLGGLEFWFRRPEPVSRVHYERLFDGAALRFGAPSDALVCPVALLDQANPRSDPALHALLLRHAEHLLALVPASPSIVPRVREVLAELLPSADSDSERVASRLGMSRRSLTRHLEREGIRYSELLEQLRHELALHQLRTSDRDVQEIAFSLGYSLTAAFSRAFRRWEGRSPNEYRRALAARAGHGVGATAPLQ